MRNYLTEYQRWIDQAADCREVLQAYSEKEIEDAFYKDLTFGTGGLRGIIGAGTNRMNLYTVAKASQGLADYVNRCFPEKRKIAVAYDSRLFSADFAKKAAEIFASNGITVYLYPELMPTPCLSFAVRYYQCAAGIVITASHNPAAYNGYKVYGSDGCQITTEAAEIIQKEIEKLDIFEDVHGMDWDASQIISISEDCVDAYLQRIKSGSLIGDEPIDRNVAIVYSPLNGSGLKPVTRVLKECGYTNIAVVEEQAQPDGHFPTCPYPNPEERSALTLGLELAEQVHGDLMLATDPDCDRVGIAVRNGQSMSLLTGNEVGMLLLDYICQQRIKKGTMPKDPLMIKTIVSIDMAERIAAHYGVKTINVLTGFKFIGEQIGFLEAKNEDQRFIFGFEESYGYLSITDVRDKDAVNGVLMICDMFAWYKSRGISLTERLNTLYDLYGFCLNTLHSYTFEGSAGFDKMQQIMSDFRNGLQNIGGFEIESCTDYALGIDNLPKSDVLKYRLAGGHSVVIRPSGTEPKLKAYLSVTAENREEAAKIEKKIAEDLERRLK